MAYKVEYSVELLEGLSIHELRRIGRDVGVKLPTTLKKDDLIDKIMKIVNGEAQAYVRKTKQGRPPKKPLIESHIADLIPNDYYARTESFFADLNIDLATLNQQLIKNGGFVGVLDVRVEGYGFVKCGGDMTLYISSHMILANNLRNGDELSVIAQEISTVKPWVVIEVKKVNGIDVADFLLKNSLRFENVKATRCDKAIKFKEGCILDGIKYGQKVLVGIKPVVKTSEIIENILKSCNDVASVVDIDAVDYNTAQYDKYNNTSVYSIKPDVKSDAAVNTAKLGLDWAVRRAEMGNNVIVVVDSLNKLFKHFNALGFENGIIALDRVDSLAVVNQKKFFDTAKNTDQGSITIILLVNQKEQSILDGYIFNEFINQCDAYLELKDGKTLNNENSFIK